MQRIDIADDVLDFLARRIDSVPHLEALLLFWENPDTVWGAAEIAARVYVSRDKGRALLLDLARHGFITPQSADPDPSYRYDSGWDEGRLMPRVADAYRKHLVPVAELIHAKAASTSVHEFARAFMFKQKE